ncbi:tetratricopeptide repeat protein [Catalinimonas niigatensis]|uniref:tetratricopeptide repeat protein n=1 Tax=Catalinimonas niigatensis TaxID=1397264 RepID=UPI002665E39E|nr:tetratricopeptide repeat protein [Catalinimonas niigatensis]WPP49921.1 tetratricopeptide repeat protein [Catalinimonas niigatensis]
MKLIIGIVVLAFTAFGVIDNIATVNRLKKEAAQAYQNGDYATAIAHYQTLLDSLQVEDPNVRLNLAHSLIQAGDTISAQRNYSRLIKVEDRNVKSVAYQQMGVIASGQKQYEEALNIFKESLKANPANEEARYNYELVKELLKKQEEEQQQNQDQQQDQKEQQDQEKQDQQQQKDQQQQDQQQQQQGEKGEQTDENEEGQKQDQQNQEGESEGKPQDPNEQNAQEGEQQQEGEKSEDEQSVSPMSDRLKEMNISEEKARMILEAMRNNEMQYIQQNRRRPEKPRDRTKPDW